MSQQQHELHTMLINGHELEFKTMLKTVASNDSKYNKLIEKCTHRLDNFENSAYQIDTEVFLHFQNRIYVPNQENIKQIIFKELHDPLRKISKISKIYNNIKK